METQYSDSKEYNDALIDENLDALFETKNKEIAEPEKGFAKFLAKLLSYILHPLLMPSFGVLLMFNNSSYMSLMSMKGQLFILTIVFLSTFAIPMLFLPWLLRKGFIRSIQMHNHVERFYPLLLTFVSFLFAFFVLQRLYLPISQYILKYILGATVIVFLCMVISTRWKISIHMAGIGGATGAILSLVFLLEANFFYHLILMIFLSGLLGFARLKQQAHSSLQVYGGYLLGILIISAVFLY